MSSFRSNSIVSLFSGAGGFSYGFASAGLDIAFGAEINKDACATYEANVGSKCFNIDLAITEPDFLTKQLGKERPFAIIGGPPCQGFSTAGRRNADDPRNRLVFGYLRIVAQLKPQWFIFENVEGLLTSGNGSALYSLVCEFMNLGYSLRVQKINLAAFGVPQTRKRVLIIGNRMGLDFSLPDESFSYDSGKSRKPNGKPFGPTLGQTLAGLGKPASSRSEFVAYTSRVPVNEYDAFLRVGNYGGVVSEHFDMTTNKDEERFAMMRQGDSMKDLPEEYWHESFRRRAFRRVMDGTPSHKRGGAPSGIKRLRENLQSLTITGAASREFIHPQENRPLTLRECARIQTFPDRYCFYGNSASVAQQIGNAVPPLAATILAQHLIDFDGKFGVGLLNQVEKRQPRLLGFRLTEASGMSESLIKTDALLRSLQQPRFIF